MKKLSEKILQKMQGRTLATAESCTGGMIGAALTAIAGSSAVYKGGIISYTNEVKHHVLGVDQKLLDIKGAVSADVAEAMAEGVRKLLGVDMAISVTGLAGPGGDEFGNPVGKVFFGFADGDGTVSYEYDFSGNREEVRRCAVRTALAIILDHLPLD